MLQFDIADSIRHHGFKRLLLAVSGGLDSICLAHYFVSNKERLGIEWLGIAHVHHGLREVTADRDAAFVEEFARKFNVPFFLKKLDGEVLKAAEGSLEENARDARYKALMDVAMCCELLAVSNGYIAKGDPGTVSGRTIANGNVTGSFEATSLRMTMRDDCSSSLVSSLSAKRPLASRLSSISDASSKCQRHDLTPHACIVTAHHAGDQSETMYMRLRRGTSLEGLRGIQELRAMSGVQSAACNERSAMSNERKEIPSGTSPGQAIQGGNDNETHNVTLEACRLSSASEAISEALRAELNVSLQDDKTKTLSNYSSPLSTAYCLLPTVFLYRPFLNFTRAELLDYAHEHNLKWCEDESNAEVKFARNKIRHVFLPHLEENVPGATKQLCRIAELADKAYEKVLEKCDALFSVALEHSAMSDERSTMGREIHNVTAHNTPSLVSSLSSFVSINKKKLNKILQAHKEADLSEMFRLWLSTKGFRFPIGFFYSKDEPAHIKIPVRAVYRRRSILKIRHTVWICEFKDSESAAKFVS